jgi:hypothetical protein
LVLRDPLHALPSRLRPLGAPYSYDGLGLQELCASEKELWTNESGTGVHAREVPGDDLLVAGAADLQYARSLQKLYRYPAEDLVVAISCSVMESFDATLTGNRHLLNRRFAGAT